MIARYAVTLSEAKDLVRAGLALHDLPRVHALASSCTGGILRLARDDGAGAGAC